MSEDDSISEQEARAAQQQHDALFRYTFSNPIHAEGELRAVLPAALLERLDFTTLTVLPRSFVDEELRARESDLLFSVRLGETPALIYVLCEHQSRADPRMPLRLLGYLVRIWEQHMKQHPEREGLPPIVPLVVHHDRAAWRAPRRLRELFSLDAETQALLAPYLPDFTFELDDLAAISPAVLHARTTLTALGKLVLFALQRARHAVDLVHESLVFGDTLEELGRSPDDGQVVFRYIFQVTQLGPERFREALRDAGRQRAAEVVMNTAERLIAQGRAEAMNTAERLIAQGRAEAMNTAERLIAQGRAEARAEAMSTAERLIAEGREQARAEMLARQVAFKFGSLPSEAQARIAGASSAELDAWSERVLLATSLEDLFR